MSSSSKLEVALFSRKSSNHIYIEPEIVDWSIVIMDAVNDWGSLNLAWSMNLYWVWILHSLHGLGFDSTAWLAAARALFMLLCPRLNHLPQASMWIDIGEHAHKPRYTHTKWYIPPNEAVSQNWLHQADVHINNCIIVSLNTVRAETFIWDLTVDYSHPKWWYVWTNVSQESISGHERRTWVNSKTVLERISSTWLMKTGSQAVGI